MSQSAKLDSFSNKHAPLHPVFIECMTHTTDPFWQKFFESCAKGKFHKDTYLTREQTLVFRTPTERLHLSIKMPANELTEKMIALHQQHLNCYSPMDLQNRSELVQQMKDDHQTHQYDSWTKVKRQTDQGSLVTDYIRRWSACSKMNAGQIQQAVHTILFMMDMKLIDSSMVTMVDGTIIGLSGVEIAHGKVVLTKLPKKIVRKPVKSKVISKSSTQSKALSVEWKKYLQSLELK